MKNNYHTKTLFLDRDGVINKQIINDYVKSVDEFEFLPNAIKAIVSLSSFFDYLIIVTNQQGIGKGFFSEQQLSKVHDYMRQQIQENNGHIDAIYYAPDVESEHNFLRKPAIGMALQAKKDFPAIDFKYSMMVGDSISDMEFGKKAGMTTVYLTKNKENVPQNIANRSDYMFRDLWEMSQQIDAPTFIFNPQK